MARTQAPFAHSIRVTLAGWLGALLLRAIGSTWRVETRGDDPFDGPDPVVGATWHRGFLIAAYQWRRRGFAVPVSQSRDGDMIDAALRHLGFAASPRGSSSHGASSVLKSAIRRARDGETLAILPDGPRGPARKAKPGAVALARASGAKLVPVGISASPCIRFGSWDRALLPLPFARVVCIYGDPIGIPRQCPSNALGPYLDEFERCLDSLTRELDAELGLAEPEREASRA